MNLDSYIEAVLFSRGEATPIKQLEEIFGKTREEIEIGLSDLQQKLEGRGIRLSRFEDEVALTTASKAGELIEKLTREELTKDLGKAGLETLSIILYHGPVSRREIDYIRGVNSQFILRNLLIRGLIQKVPSEKDQRTFLYKATLELLSFLGLEKINDLPQFNEVRKEIEEQASKLAAHDKAESKEETEKKPSVPPAPPGVEPQEPIENPKS